MKNKNLAMVLLSAMTVLAGCASIGEHTAGEADITLAQVQAGAADLEYKPVRWGGSIVSAENLQDSTTVQIVAYPLDSGGRPNLVKAPLGRFIAKKQGYLETADYAPGRLVTVDGSVLGTETGKVGEADYVFGRVLAHELKLWPKVDPAAMEAPRPSVHFGFGFGSGGRSGVGIGVGF